MATYYMNEGAFDLPDSGFVDRTLHLLEASHPEHGDVLLIVRRSTFPGGKSLRELTAAFMQEEKEKLDGHRVLEERESSWGGAPALEIASRWRHDGKVIYQRQANFALGETWISFSVRAPLASRAACDAWMAQIQGSVRLRDA